METTNNGVQKAQFQEINLSSFNNNASILDGHLSNEDIHVNACNIAGVAEADELKQIDFTDTNNTMWGKIKKSISEVTNHVDKTASDSILGHVKIGDGLQTAEDGITSVKIANDLETDDETTALSAAMGIKLGSDVNTLSASLANMQVSGAPIGGHYIYSTGTSDKTMIHITPSDTSHLRMFIFGDRNGEPVQMVITNVSVLNSGVGSATIGNGIVTIALSQWSYITVIANFSCTFSAE